MSVVLIEAANMTKEFFSVALRFLRASVFPAFPHQRSFKVDKPKRTSIIVMIQNRTTTWFSFQPFNS